MLMFWTRAGLDSVFTGLERVIDVVPIANIIAEFCKASEVNLT